MEAKPWYVGLSFEWRTKINSSTEFNYDIKRQQGGHLYGVAQSKKYLSHSSHWKNEKKNKRNPTLTGCVSGMCSTLFKNGTGVWPRLEPVGKYSLWANWVGVNE